MRASVTSNWITDNTPLEGFLPYMYTDSLGFVTTGMGNEIDSVAQAASLPWKNPDGSATSYSDVAAQWQAVKEAYPGVQSVNCENLTTARITRGDIVGLVTETLSQHEKILTRYFPGFGSWPADGQMGLLFMSWAMGPGFPPSFPAFSAALNESPPNFAKVVASGQYEFRGSGVAARIADVKKLLQNAADVTAKGLDPETLFYPEVVGSFSIVRLGELAALGVGLGAIAGWLWIPGVRGVLKGWMRL